jgi:hypothetical protein
MAPEVDSLRLQASAVQGIVKPLAKECIATRLTVD